MAQKGGPCLRGQRLLDNAPCQAVAGLDSGALPFPRYCASLVQTKADRLASGSPFGGAGEELATRLRGLGRCQTALHSDSIALTKSLPIAAPTALSRRACPLRHLRCHCPGCGSQRLLRCRLHPAGRGPNSSSLFPPLAAVVAVAPRGRALGRPGSSELDA